MNEVSITKAEILRTAEAIRQAGCRDVLIVYAPDFVRFVVTIKLPKSR
jgi:2-iminoacetate synthase ThiH